MIGSTGRERERALPGLTTRTFGHILMIDFWLMVDLFYFFCSPRADISSWPGVDTECWAPSLFERFSITAHGYFLHNQWLWRIHLYCVHLILYRKATLAVCLFTRLWLFSPEAVINAFFGGVDDTIVWGSYFIEPDSCLFLIKRLNQFNRL